jgi:hypothetical protein
MKIRYIIVINEVISVVLAMLGVIILIFSFFPLINPSHYNVANQEIESGVWRYICGAILAFVFLFISLKINKRSIALRGNKFRK